MVRVLKGSRFAIGFVILFAVCTQAATYRRLSFDSLIAASDYVIYGRAASSHAYRDPATGAIWTETQFQVLDCVKGRSGQAITVTEPGGVLDDRGELYPGMPQFRVNAELVLFLYRAPGNRLRVVGALQGVYAVSKDPADGQRMVACAASRQQIFYQEGASLAATAKSANTAPEMLNSFLQSIRRKAAAR